MGGSGFLPARALNPFENAASLYAGVINSGVIYDYVIPSQVGRRVCAGEEFMISDCPRVSNGGGQTGGLEKREGHHNPGF